MADSAPIEDDVKEPSDKDQNYSVLQDAIQQLRGRVGPYDPNYKQAPSDPSAKVPNSFDELNAQNLAKVQPYIKPEDRNTYPNSLPQNYLINKLGLPDSLRTSRADIIENNSQVPITAVGGGIAGIPGAAAAGVGETAAEALSNAQPSWAGRIGRVIKPSNGLGKVTVEEPLTYAQIIARRAMQAGR